MADEYNFWGRDLHLFQPDRNHPDPHQPDQNQLDPYQRNEFRPSQYQPDFFPSFQYQLFQYIGGPYQTGPNYPYTGDADRPQYSPYQYDFTRHNEERDHKNSGDDFEKPSDHTGDVDRPQSGAKYDYSNHFPTNSV